MYSDETKRPPRVLFIHNFVSHYTQRTFQLLAHRVNVSYLFFSGGRESYWLPEHGVRPANFAGRYLSGITVGGTRIVPELPYVLLTEKYDVVVKCINGRFALPIAFLASRLRRKPFVLWTGIWTRLCTPFHRLVFPLTRFIYRHADAIVVYGVHVKRYLVSEGVQAERVFIAEHAVDNAFYSRPVAAAEIDELRSQLDVPAGSRIVLYLGRLERIKGLNYLMEGFAALSRHDAILVIAGVGTERRNLEDLAARLGIWEKVRFTGYVPIQDAIRYYAAAWVYVLPSITTVDGREAWGLVVNEAFNQGAPVIATEAVGAAAGELVRDGLDGFVVPEKDSAALERALAAILDSPALREKLSQNAKAVIAQWDQERMVEKFEAAIQFALNRTQRRVSA